MRPWERHQFWFFIAGIGLVGSLFAPWQAEVEIVDPAITRNAFDQSQVVRTRGSLEQAQARSHQEPRRIPAHQAPSRIQTVDHSRSEPAALSSRMKLMPVSWGNPGSDLFGEIVTAESELRKEEGPLESLSESEQQPIPKSVWLAGQIEMEEDISEDVPSEETREKEQRTVAKRAAVTESLPQFNIRITPSYRK